MIYEYECKQGHRTEIICKLSEHQSSVQCATCGEQAEQVISAVYGFTKRECRYDCPITGIPITSYAQHRDNLARHGCQEYDPEMKTDAANYRKEQDERLDKAVEETVERSIEGMPGSQRERLGRELETGADIDLTRN